jgi:hypothetical protein
MSTETILTPVVAGIVTVIVGALNNTRHAFGRRY